MTLFVSVNTHQGAECFNTESRGKQCAFMSLSAILTAEGIPLFEWSQSTIDNILVQGDYLYVKALNNGLFGINPEIELTSIDNLPRFVEVSCKMNILSFELIDTTVNNINYEEPPVCCMKNPQKWVLRLFVQNAEVSTTKLHLTIPQNLTEELMSNIVPTLKLSEASEDDLIIRILTANKKINVTYDNISFQVSELEFPC